MLASNDVARRYRRSRVGQLWFTLSMALMIAGLGLVYATIFKVPLAEYMPHVGVGIVVWGYISGTIVDSCQTFIESEGMIKQVDLPLFTYVMRLLSRHLIILAHNIVIVPFLMLAFGVAPTVELLLAVPGLLIVTANLLWISYMLAIVSARFRDVPQIVGSLMQIAFFVTPVMFTATLLGRSHQWLLLSPLACFLEIVREPILGRVPSMEAYVISFVVLVLGWLCALVFADKYSRRVVYWL